LCGQKLLEILPHGGAALNCLLPEVEADCSAAVWLGRAMRPQMSTNMIMLEE
jgi:hypothetical protein